MFTAKKFPIHAFVLIAGLTVAAVSGCGGGSTPAQDAAAAAATAAEKQAEADRAAELAAKTADIARREEELALKQREQELAEREAEVAARESAVGKKPRKAATPAPSKPVAVAAAEKPATPVPPPPPVTMAVPAGTQLSVELTSGLSSKTSVIGEAFNARLATDVMVDGRRALAAGTRVTGTVTDVISGSNRIGGIPTLGLRFDSVEAPSGKKIGISGALVQQGKSDNLKDGAKIAGGAAAGAIIGHQIKSNDGGKIIGGLLGGAAGALIARKTGAEVELPAGTVLAIVLDSPFEVTTRP
ncbi:MAG: glycine zipper 2TM domain-containing protein [Pseudomonadota bacterium]